METCLHLGDSLAILPTLPDNSIDSVVCDPPYHLKAVAGSTNGNSPHARQAKGFMGMAWDGGDIANNPDLWREVLRVLKPGGHLLAFGGTRTYHRMTCAIEDAGFEIRDSIHWVYSTGFPKSKNVSLGIDKGEGHPNRGRAIPTASHFQHGTTTHLTSHPVPDYDPKTEAAKQWKGWGTALKPAHEPIVLARKPLEGTVAANVLEHGTGALNIDGTRIPLNGDVPSAGHRTATFGTQETVSGGDGSGGWEADHNGRWPANILFDKDAAEDLGENARYFYCCKPGKSEKNAGTENTHPTVKPITLMRYLCRLVTPPGGTVLDPFMGSGTTGCAAVLEGFNFIGIDMTPEYVEIARARIEHWTPKEVALPL